MVIYYLMVKAVPNYNNPESEKFGGAYINCWVKASTQKDAINCIKEYIVEENWTFVNIEDVSVVERSLYLDKPDSLKCYDDACEYGICATFYTWPIGECDIFA
ncbi:MAG: hypothetical protein J6C01_07650 [Lachnospiraceae bacterium]|nr:hypothetical protein [Lachnospiraceae bacterium]